MIFFSLFVFRFVFRYNIWFYLFTKDITKVKNIKIWILFGKSL